VRRRPRQGMRGRVLSRLVDQLNSFDAATNASSIGASYGFRRNVLSQRGFLQLPNAPEPACTLA
jgi:hypothetical protein